MPAKLALMAIAVFLLIACDKTYNTAANSPPPTQNLTPSQTIAAIDESLAAANKKTAGNQITFAQKPLDYVLPQDVMDGCVSDDSKPSADATLCPAIQITLADVNPAWIAHALQKAMTTDDGIELRKFHRKLDEFARDSIDRAERSHWSMVPTYLGMHGSLAQFGVHTSIGDELTDEHSQDWYYVFDLDLQSQITIHDVIAPNTNVASHAPFEILIQDAYAAYLATHDDSLTDQKIKRLIKACEHFAVSENFYFKESGLVLHYNGGQLCKERDPISLTLPYDKLGEIIRAEYLPSHH